MKTCVVPCDRWFLFRTIPFALGLLLIPSIACHAESWIDEADKARWALRDQLQQVVMKSVKGVGEAMQEGPPPDNSLKPFTGDDLKQVQQKNANLLSLNNGLAQQQQQLLELDNKLLKNLPPNDPRRADLENEMKKLGTGLPETHKAVENYKNKLGEANVAIDKWNKAHPENPNIPLNIPPQTKKEPVQPPKTEPPPDEPVQPPKTDDGLDNLKQSEAAKEAEARKLGKEREAAVNKYLDDPTPENRAEAAGIKEKLQGLVDDLNATRGQVDNLSGTSRPPLKIKTAQQIAKKHKKKRGGPMGSGTEGHHHGPDGTDTSSSGSEGHHHAPDGTDVPNTQSGGGGGGGGGGRRAGGRRQRRQTQSNVASPQGHTHNAAGMDVPNQQYQQGARQKKNRQQTQQRKRQNKNRY